MLLLATNNTLLAIAVFLACALLLIVFIYVGIASSRAKNLELDSNIIPPPISDHEQLWQSVLPYENLGSGGDQEKLVVYTMAHINAKSMRDAILSFASERETMSFVSRIIRVTTLPSFNDQYKRGLELSKSQIEEVVEEVLRLLSR